MINDEWVINIKKELYFITGHKDYEQIDKITCWNDTDDKCVFITQDIEKITSQLERNMIKKCYDNIKRDSEKRTYDIQHKIELLKQNENKIKGLKVLLTREEKLKKLLK